MKYIHAEYGQPGESMGVLSDLLSAGALVVSIAAAGYYRSQAKSAKRAAQAAEDSVELTKQSASTAERSASASEHSASASTEAATEARRMRQDALGPSVVIDKVTPLSERWMSGWNGPTDSPPGIAAQGDELASSAQDHVLLLMGVHIAVRNEGTRTARVQFEGRRVDRAGPTVDSPETQKALEPPGDEPSRRVGGGTITLQPGETSGVIVRVGVTLKEWISDPDPSFLSRIEAAIASERDGSHQVWELHIDGPILEPKFQHNDTYRVVAHLPVKTVLVNHGRRYPEPADELTDRPIQLAL